MLRKTMLECSVLKLLFKRTFVKRFYHSLVASLTLDYKHTEYVKVPGMHVYRLLYIVVVAAVMESATVAQQPEPKPAPEWEPSADFKDGMAVGAALQAAAGVSNLCVQVLSRIEDDASQQDPNEIYTDERALAANQLMHCAWLMHRAVELPDSVFPHKASLKKRLRMVSDYLHENHATLVDLKAYEAGRKKYFEELKHLIKDAKARRLLREGYDRNIETIRILAKYRSTGESDETNDKE